MNHTDFLFARPSFWGGVASAFDLGSTLVLYNESLTPEEADFRAIRSDWEMVGQDLWSALGALSEEVPEPVDNPS